MLLAECRALFADSQLAEDFATMRV